MGARGVYTFCADAVSEGWALVLGGRAERYDSAVARPTVILPRGTNAITTCTHVKHIRDVTPSARGCEDCLKIGGDWVHLRLCLSCGHVGCCDSSKNKHATKHFRGTHHPIIRSFEPGEDWKWCYVDEVMLE
jgi:Zn-finger in ubiquitin-hydrolases and other protein